MNERQTILWALWATTLSLLGIYAAFPLLVPNVRPPWPPERVDVTSFVLILLCMASAVSSFALRESLLTQRLRSGLLDTATLEGARHVRRVLIGCWVLCAAIGTAGFGLELLSAKPAVGWPYLVAAAALLVLHAPRASLWSARTTR